MGNKPGPEHPWRNYANKIKPHNGESRPQVKPLQTFLTEIAENWTHVEVTTKYRGRYDRFVLVELPDYIVADWVVKMLRNYQHGQQEPEETFE